MIFTNPLALILLLTLPVFLWLGWPRAGWGRGRKVAALVLRLLIVLSLILGLAGMQIVRAVDKLAVVFLVDASDSMPEATVEAARQYVQEAIDAMRPTDEAAIIVFGSDALVERPMSPVREVGPLESEVLPLNTDLAEAIRLGLALYPPGAARRMVVLSDGLANVGDAEDAARLAEASGVEIVSVPYALTLGPEVLVTDVDVPTRLNENQTFDMTVTVEASEDTTASLRVLGGGEVLVEQGVELVTGVNRYAFTLTAPETGLNTFRVQIIPSDEDAFYQNNELSAFTQVVGPPRVLVVTEDPAESVNIEDALLAQGLTVDRTSGTGMPADLATLSAYQSVVMVNVPASALGPRKMQVIQAYVRDLGGGLVTVGGPETYGPGGYFQTPLEETLPVEMQLKDQERIPQMSIVYVIDTSGSMADYSPGGYPKIELAKEAILRSVQLLGPLDRVGVTSFDTEAAWVVPLGPASDRDRIAGLVGGLRAGGGTDIYAGLLAASRVLPDDPSKLRHIILLTDGGASETGIPELVSEMYDDYGITLSVIAITAQNEQYGGFIEDLPDLAGGRFHHAYNTDSIPEIFTQELLVATRAYIIEHEFAPTLTSSSPILSGIDAVPPLYGYIGASTKPAAQQILATDLDDPLLSAWQYGLGRSVAWTSDATGRWAADWVQWPQFARFWSQAVRWTITEGANQNVEVRVTQEGERVRVTVDALAEDDSYLNNIDMTASIVAPDLSTTALELRQVAPGQYEATFTPEDEGAYFVRVAGAGEEGGEAAVAQTSGWVLAYSPEYRSFEGDPDYLAYIAGLTGGSVVQSPADVFAHNLHAERASQPIWMWLLLAAAILLPFDIGVRRLVLTRSDFAKLIAWRGIGRRRSAATAERGASRVGSLLDVKDRVSQSQERAVTRAADRRPARQEAAPLSTNQSPEAQPSAPSERKPPRRAAQPAKTEGSTVSSLLASKRRRETDDDE